MVVGGVYQPADLAVYQPGHLLGAPGGFTMSLPTEDRNYHRKTEMEDDLVVLLGGRVAEQLVLEDISTGASNDIQPRGAGTC